MILTQPRHRYPSVPADQIEPQNFPATRKLLDALRERVQIYGRDRGRIEDSMVRIQDLLDLGIISQADLTRLQK